MREALNGRPRGERTRKEYQRAIDSYRRVYFGSPASSKADPSVVATAELMVEMGRRFDDNKILRAAVEQYRFLRKEYPGSKYRFDALFTIGEIYKDDLNDPEEARTTFAIFLERYPHNRLADDARSAIREIDEQADAMEHSALHSPLHSPQKMARRQRSSGGKVRDGNAGGSATASADDGAGSVDAATVHRSALPRVTGVRHWSTPDYTRVAIDVEQEVKFGSQRISNPDRIFFDLRDTKLASTLVGKTFDVDDGFLKTIRVAEFQPGRTRIVLEVDDLASYDAFLLPDPYRLIIDVHGKDGHGKGNRASVASKPETAKADIPESDDGIAGEGASGEDLKAAGRKAKPASDKEMGGSSKSGIVETDLPAEDAGADSQPPASAKAANGNRVIKTTVAVNGSNRRIPKTIVEADQGPNEHGRKDRRPKDQGPKDQASKDQSSKNQSPSDRGVSDSAAAATATLEPEKILPETTDGSDGAAGNGSASPSSPTPSPSSARRKKSRSATPPAATETADLIDSPASREARPTAAGDRSLTRALGLKIGKIVIDAGHGGHDTGTIGPNGLLEKDVVLDVAKRLGRLLESRLGAEVIYTRRDDTFIPLETRTAIANRERADLFISIHANSSRDSDARGVETYYLNFTSSPEALEVAARENAVSEKSIHELQDLVKKIALKDKIDESREFAGDVQESLYGGLALNNAGIRNRGTKKAPFIVLIGANMPSILAEISFVSNPTDERKLETSEHRQRIAESLYRGVSKYVNGLSGVKVASKIDKHEGQ